MDPLAQLLGQSPEIVAVREQVRGLLKRQAEARRLPPILIQGETGTGKGLVARAMHAASVRASGPFVDVNCAAIPETLLEAEMFGVERGAFTDARQSRPGLFQLAHRGTIFLDEIGLLPEALQAKLLKVIEEREVRRLGGTRSEPVDVWVVAATNEDLAAATSARRFRADLYHRLAVVTLSLPALRDRRNDVLLLAEHFLARACADYGMAPKVLASDARAALLRYPWPGNIRELSNVMERVVLLGASEQVTAAVLGLAESAPLPTPARGPAPVTLEAAVDDVERAHLLDALGATNWNVSQAAARLGISRNTLRYRIEKHGLRPGAPALPRRGRRPAAAREQTPPAPAAVAPSPGARARRRLTLLRAVLLAPAGAEASALSRRTLALLSDKARVFGGRVEEVNAAGVVAVFGLEPVEDAPARAAHAAIAVLNGVERVRRDEAGQLQVKVAIHVDQFLVNHGPGPAIELEARPHAWAFLDSLLEGAGPDDIVVSEAAAPFLRRSFDLTQTTDGHAFHLGGGERAGLGLRRRLGAFVGRQHELELLRSRFDSATSGRGQVVGIAGDAGIGKSRLLLEFRQTLGHAVGCIEGACRSYGATMPFLPVLDLLRALCGIADADTPTAVEDKLGAALGAAAMNGAENAAFLLHLLGLKEGADRVARLNPDEIKARAFETLEQLTLRSAQGRALVVLVEDLHWIDRASEEFLALLAEAAAAAPIMLVTTYRSGYRPPWIDHSYATQVALQPIDAEHAARIVRSVKGGDTIPAPLVDLILRKAEGNPFFLEELARVVGEQGTETAALSVPDTIREVLEARIDRLPAEERRLLQTAAVFGKDAALADLATIVGAPAETLRPTLRRLRAAEFLQGTAFGAVYTFKHALTQEVAYGGLAEDERRRLHARIAELLELRHAGRMTEHVEQVARHAFHGGVWDKAVAHLRQAGRKAAARSAHREAVGFFEQALAALQHLPTSPPTVEHAVDIRFDLRNSLHPLGEFGRIVEYLQEAKALAQARADEHRLGQVLTYETQYFRLLGELGRAVQSGEEAVAIADRLDDIPLRVVAITHLGPAYAAQGDYDKAVDILRANVASIRGALAHDPLGLAGLPSVFSRSYLVSCLAERGEFKEGVAYGEDAIRLARAADHAYSLAFAHWGLGHLLLLKGDLEQARPLLERGFERCQAFNFRLMFPLLASSLGSAYGLVGRHDEALRLLQQAVQQATSMARIGGQSIFLTRLGESYLLAGRPGEAGPVAERALQYARKHGERGHEAYALRFHAELCIRRDQPNAAEGERAFGEALGLAEGLGMRPLAAHCHRGLAALHRQTGRPADAERHRAVATRLLSEMEMRFWLERPQSE